MSSPRLKSQLGDSRRYMSSDKAHFAWVIARDLFGYWSRPEPTQCICQCPENVCSCPALECSAHLEVIKELSVEQSSRASVTCPVCEAECEVCAGYPWFLIFVLVVSVFVASGLGYLIGRSCGRGGRKAPEAQRSIAQARTGPFFPSTLAALED